MFFRENLFLFDKNTGNMYSEIGIKIYLHVTQKQTLRGRETNCKKIRQH